MTLPPQSIRKFGDKYLLPRPLPAYAGPISHMVYYAKELAKYQARVFREYEFQVDKGLDHLEALKNHFRILTNTMLKKECVTCIKRHRMYFDMFLNLFS